jgi:cytochrome c556
MSSLWYNPWTSLVFLVCLAVSVTGVQAQATDEALVQYRQKVMQSQGASMGAIGDVMKNKLPYQSHIATHARDIQQQTKLIGDAFQKDIAEGKTDAKAEIWKDWSKFIAAAKEVEDESAKLAEVAQSGNMEAIGAQVKKLGDACGNCHKPFRKPKEESYKNK